MSIREYFSKILRIEMSRDNSHWIVKYRRNVKEKIKQWKKKVKWGICMMIVSVIVNKKQVIYTNKEKKFKLQTLRNRQPKEILISRIIVENQKILL